MNRMKIFFNYLFFRDMGNLGEGCLISAFIWLRWMVRKDSPVDLGIWQRVDPKDLIIPLDVHVHNVALELGLTSRKRADMKAAMEVTEAMRQIFPDDPARGDFALFGYGIEKIKD